MLGTTKIELVHPHSNQGEEHRVLTHIHIEERRIESARLHVSVCYWSRSSWEEVMNGFIKTALAKVWTQMVSASLQWLLSSNKHTQTCHNTDILSLIPAQPTPPPTLLALTVVATATVWCWCKFQLWPQAFINIKLETSMTSQIIFKKQHLQFRISFNQTETTFITHTHTHTVEHTTPQPEGDEETAVTPWKKKAMKRRIKEAKESK